MHYVKMNVQKAIIMTITFILYAAIATILIASMMW